MQGASFPRLRLVMMRGCPILEQLQLEEALLRADQGNWCLINQGSPPAIVMGISGKPELLINQPLFQNRPVPLIRRFSGGGTVFVDEHTYFVTLICNRQEVNVSCCPQRILNWTAELYRSAFPVGFHLMENDYVLGDKKFGGNAQYLSKDRWLHHTSLLWDYNPAHMEYLLFPPKTPRYRGQRNHREFLCRLCDHHADKKLLETKLVQALARFFIIEEVPLAHAATALRRPHRKAACMV